MLSPPPQILNLLTEQEVMSVVPSQAIVPRTFVLKPGMSLFVGALARIDFLQVPPSQINNREINNKKYLIITSDIYTVFVSLIICTQTCAEMELFAC